MQKYLAFLLLAIFISPLLALPTERLPQAKAQGKMSLEEAIYHRRSERSFNKKYDLSREQLAQLLWACQGITEPNWGFRTVPSAGTTYPLEVYIVMKDGVYHYLPKVHSIEKVSGDDKRPAMFRASLGQGFISDAPATFVIAANFGRTQEKYGNRAERYVPMEAGHAAQNLLLQATAMGLGGVPVGSFYIDAVARSLDLPYENEPLYLIPVGYLNK